MHAAARLCVSTCAIVSILAVVSRDAVGAHQEEETPVTAFVVSETAEGDLNGDGDTLDMVVHVFTADDGVTENLGLAVPIICQSVVFCQPVLPAVNETTVAFVVREDAQGETDLNGDADTFDDVLFVYEADKHRLSETGLAAAHGIGRDVSSYRFVIPPVVLEDTAVFLVHETEQGMTDLNGDGDIFDAVFFLVRPTSHKVVNLGLAAATVFGPFGSRNPLFGPPTLDGHTLTVVVGEFEQGEMDLNGNGIASEEVPFAVHIRSGRARLAE